MTDYKILIDARLLNKYPTGISRYTEEVIKSYVKSYGAESVGIIVNDSYWLSRYENVLVVPYLPFNLLHFFKFYLFLKKLKYKVLHSTFYSGVFNTMPGKTNILTLHDLTYKIVDNYFSANGVLNLIAIRLFDSIVNKSIRNADLIISVSQTTSQDLERFYGKESIVIPEGINVFPEEKQNKESTILDRLDLESGSYFFYIGNLRKNKNIGFMINSFIKSKTNSYLILAGRNDSADIEGYEKHENVRFIGYVADEDLPHLFRNCIAFVFPSLYEGFGLPVLEALNNGACVLSSTGGALKEFSSEVVTFFDPKSDSELINLFRQNKFKFKREAVLNELKKYNWEDNMDLMQQKLKVYIEEKI